VSSELTASHNAVYGQVWWDARAMAQSADRHAGINQQNTVLAHVLMAKGSVEETIWDRVLLKGRAMEDLDEAAARIQGIEWGELEDVD
jgi:SNF2 family DNA or RNA helicase